MVRIDFQQLMGRYVMVYGQTQLQRDLYEAIDERGGVLIDEALDATLHDVDGESPYVTFRKDGAEERVDCDFIAGCDGAHAMSRDSIPASLMETYERMNPFGWLGILSETPPVNDELIYANHRRGFALCSMRNPMLSRYYLQCPLDTDLDEWPDERFWEELCRRLPEHVADRLVTGPSIDKAVTPLRSYLVEPIRYGRLFLAGDAGHVMPPTGAKGLNMALADVILLARAFVMYYEKGDEEELATYSERALRRVWKVIRFSWWMTELMHRLEERGEFGQRIQEAELDYVSSSEAAQRALVENYTGLPLE